MINTIWRQLTIATQKALCRTFALVLCSIILEALTFFLIIPIFQAIFTNHDALITNISLLLLCVALHGLLLFHALRAGYLSGVSLSVGLITRLLQHLPMVNSPSQLADHQPQQLVRHSVLEAMAIPAHFLEPMLRTTVTPLVFSILLLMITPMIATVLLAIFIALILLVYQLTQRSQNLDHQKQQADLTIAEALQIFANQQPLLRACQDHKVTTAQLQTALNQQNQIAVNLMQHKLKLDMLYSAILQGLLMVAVVSAIITSQSTDADYGLMLALLIALFYFLEPYTQLIHLGQALNNAWRSLLNIITILELPLIDHIHQPTQLIANNAIEIRDLHYANDNQTILHAINHRFEANTLTVIIGPSGAGKSTLLQLIARNLTSQDRAISIGDVPLENFSHQQITELRCLFSQHALLFNGSVAWNIHMGQSQKIAKTEPIIKAVGLADEINRMPNGIENLVGPNGNLLSGGQRARVALARLFLSDAPILLLDEPTANLDAERSSMLKNLITQRKGQQTLIIITHDPALTTIADQVLLLKDGKIEATGTHETLIDSNKWYKEFYHQDSANHE